MSLDLGIRRMLSVDWSHMTREDSAVLVEWFRKDESPVLLASFEDGWFMHVWGKDEGPKEEGGLSGAFHKILELCRQQDCDYVLFDCEGATHGCLETHDW